MDTNTQHQTHRNKQKNSANASKHNTHKHKQTQVIPRNIKGKQKGTKNNKNKQQTK